MTRWKIPTDLLTVPEAAATFGKSERFILDELRRKNLRGYKVGGSWRISEADLGIYFASMVNVSEVRGRS